LRIVVVGLGKIGLRLLWLLTRLGVETFGVSSSYEDVKKARNLGLEAYIGDVFSSKKLLQKYGMPDAVATALPGQIGFEAVAHLAKNGFNVVDVSFFPEDPLALNEIALKSKVSIVVDAGIAPGLSNILVGRGHRLVKGKNAIIYVGGITREPDTPLGIAATWSVEDLLEEYVRPARLKRDGKVIRLDPLWSEEGRITIEGVGELEYFPTDGLRTLLYSLKDIPNLAEYTLRWPGHLDFMRNLAKLGFLSSNSLNVHGCPISPRSCLARVLENYVSNKEDLVVLRVVVEGEKGTAYFQSIIEPQDEWSAMSISTTAVQVALALEVAKGTVEPGLHFPEEFGVSREHASRVMRFVQEWGVPVAERIQVD
jgi:lysine 6-dehydrogenase